MKARRVLSVIAILLVTVGLLLGAGYLAIRRPDLSYETLDRTYASPASNFIEMGDGVTAHYRDEGNPNGRTLLLIHGFSVSLHGWDKWVHQLSGDYRVVRVDLPGHGLTRTPAGYEPSMDGFADFADAFAEKLALGRVTTVGCSMGGDVAWRLALRHPARSEALVLIGSAGWPDPRTNAGGTPLIFRLMQSPTVSRLLREIDTTAMVRPVVKATFVNQALAEESTVTRIVEFSRAPNHREVLLALMLGPKSAFATPEGLAAIKVPTLILHGTHDNLIPVQAATRFRDAIPGAQMVVYENVGHVPNEEIPERSANDLRSFLGRHSVGPK